MSMTPSPMVEVAASVTFRQHVDDNFRKLVARAWKFTASEVLGIPTTNMGPPGSGAHVTDEWWRDAKGAVFKCTSGGTPGTWIQVAPAVVTTNPVGAPTGYWIVRADLDFEPFVHDGSSFVSIGGGVPDDFGGGEIFNFRAKERSISANTTMAASDNGLWVNVSSGSDITVTIDSAASLPTGWSASFYQAAAGKVIFAGAGTHVIRNWQAADRTVGAYSVAMVKRIGATDDFVLSGNVS